MVLDQLENDLYRKLITSCCDTSRNYNWTNYLIERFEYLICWPCLSKNIKLIDNLIEKYKDKVDWYNISKYQTLPEEFIKKYKNRLYLRYIGNYYRVREECYWCKIKLKTININNKLISYCPNCLR